MYVIWKGCLWISLVSLIGLSCKGPEANPRPIPVPEFDFQIPVSLSPAKARYQVGDTIWLAVNIPPEGLRDTTSGTLISLPNAIFHLSLGAGHIFPFPVNGEDRLKETFSIFSANGDSLSRSVIPNIYFGCDSAQWQTKVGFVPLIPGILGISLEHPAAYYVVFGANFDCENPTTSEDYRLATLNYQFDVADANLDAYLNAGADSLIKQSINVPPVLPEVHIQAKRVFVLEVE